MEQDSLTTVFSGVDVFRGLSGAQLETLAGAFRRDAFGAGDVLLGEGDNCRALYLVLDGDVEVYLPAENGEANRFSDLRLATLGPGDVFGEYSFVDMRPASASIRAVSDGALALVDHGELRRILDADCEVGRRFYENLLLILIDRLRKDDRELDLMSGGWS